MIRVASVIEGSIGARLGIPPGAVLLAIDGRALEDALDLRFAEAEEHLELEVVHPDGERVVYDIQKDFDDSLGLIPRPDKIRRCTNACPFCFVKGNPKAGRLRAGLYIKDDDFRLSFLYGHYVTLTNLRDADWDRIVEQRLSPLYVSVHATDPAVRLAMLRNPRSGDLGIHLDRLAAGAIRIHAQVVLCPGLNDGAVLTRTITDLFDRGEDVLSLSIVPVGLTKYNSDRGVRPLLPVEARRVLAQIDEARDAAFTDRGFGWCYGADELFLIAGRDLPGLDYFDDRELAANGVGAISRLRDLVQRDLRRLPSLAGRRIALLTGRSMEPHLARLGDEIAAASGARIRTVGVTNELFGESVTTAGLLSGEDHRRALRELDGFDAALFSRAALGDDGTRFLDDVTLDDLRSEFHAISLWPSEHITDVLIPA
ncbi:MAG: DUF512 domain-containing protein [Gemmatimonadota bacterium]